MKAPKTAKNKKQDESTSFIRWRFILLCGCIVLALAGLLARVAYLQIIAPEKLVKEGDMRSLRVQEVATSRGMISDREGRQLAVSVPVNAIWVDPKEVFEKGGSAMMSTGKHSLMHLRYHWNKLPTKYQ